MRNYFPKLYGNNAVKSRLGASIDDGTLPHAFLIIGPKGSGKRTLALEISSALNCENQKNGSAPLPCHACNTCRRIENGSFTDIKVLKRQGDKATIGVDEIRAFREDMFLSSTESVYKIYIIEEADKLTPNAQNALLTVLEEPPPNVIMLLLAESADSILTTIKSRAQSIFAQRFEKEALKTYITSHSEKARLYSKNEPALLDGILMSSDGRIGRALSLLSDNEAESNAKKRSETESIANAMRQGAPYSELYTELLKLSGSKSDFIDSLEELMSAIRDLILLKKDKSAPMLFYTDREKATATSERISQQRLLKIYDTIKNALEDAAKNVSVSVIISNLGAKIKLI